MEPSAEQENKGRDALKKILAMSDCYARIQAGKERYGWKDHDVLEFLIGGMYHFGHQEELATLISWMEKYGTGLTDPPLPE